MCGCSRTGVDLQLLAHGTTERVLRQHALHGMLDDAFGMLGHGLGEGLGLQPAGIATMTVVNLVRSLRARHADLVRVDDDHEVARVDVRGVLRLVLALEDLRSFGRHAAEHLVGRVDQDPFALDFAGLRLIRFHFCPPLMLPLRECASARGLARPVQTAFWQGFVFQKCRSFGCRFPTPTRLHGPGLPLPRFLVLLLVRGF